MEDIKVYLVYLTLMAITLALCIEIYLLRKYLAPWGWHEFTLLYNIFALLYTIIFLAFCIKTIIKEVRRKIKRKRRMPQHY